MFSTIYQIIKNTFRESLREPIFLLLLLTSLTLIGIIPNFTMFVFRKQIKLVVDTAMATTMLFGWVIAVLSASHTISREIKNGTALLVLSKPVNRPAFIASKIGGILAGLSIFCLLNTVATLLALRIAKDQFRLDNTVIIFYFGSIVLSLFVAGLRNYFTQANFPMSAIMALLVILPVTAIIVYFLPVKGKHVGLSWEHLPALILIFYSVCIMGTLATALSTRLDLVPNLIICSMFFIVGLMSDYLIGRFTDTSISARIMYAVFPNWQLFWMADALAADKHIPMNYLGLGAVYMLLFVTFFIASAIYMFRNREVGNQQMLT